MISTQPHERFSAVVSLDPSATSAFAHAVGDTNPMHHDADYAATTRFGRLLASGLEFWVRFRRPVYADETITLEWLVISVKKNSRLDGEIIDLRGRIRNQTGETAVGAKGRVLVTENLRPPEERKTKC
jgi:3-hydroxybutyryl-CoA dehydratase